VIEQLTGLAEALPGEFALALAFFALTSALVAAGVPGVIAPLSFSSGALLGGWLGMLVIVAGTLAGSQTLFLVVRHMLREPMQRRLGERLVQFEQYFERRGVLYIVGLRIAGAPHVLVTAGSAMVRLRPTVFAVATVLGFLPVVALTAMAGSAV
jgi:uncharacterized membrane protein YdjX (TVP38/TMEM64 family)